MVEFVFHSPPWPKNTQAAAPTYRTPILSSLKLYYKCTYLGITS